MKFPKIHIQHINDKKALQSAIIWAKRSVELNDSAESNFSLMRLHNKIRDKKNAKVYAQKAKNIITSMD